MSLWQQIHVKSEQDVRSCPTDNIVVTMFALSEADNVNTHVFRIDTDLAENRCRPTDFGYNFELTVSELLRGNLLAQL